MNMTRQDLDRARIYWFARALSDGTLTLNRAGYYYVALNFSLLFITLLGLAAFLSMAAQPQRNASAVSDLASYLPASDAIVIVDVKRMLNETMPAILAAYQAGATTREVGERYGLAHSSVNKLLKRRKR